MGNIEDGLRDVVAIDDPIKIGSGQTVRAIKKGTLPLMLIQENGDTVDVALKDYKYAPEFDVCLFSLMKAIQSGWKLSNQGTHIILTKGKQRIKFDRISTTKDGMLCGVDMITRIGEEAHNEGIAAPEAESGGESGINSNSGTSDAKKEDQEDDPKNKKPDAHWEINRFHRIFGHAAEDALKATAKHCNWKLTGNKFEACESCQMSNVQQKKVSKTTDTESTVPGERIFVDMYLYPQGVS